MSKIKVYLKKSPDTHEYLSRCTTSGNTQPLSSPSICYSKTVVCYVGTGMYCSSVIQRSRQRNRDERNTSKKTDRCRSRLVRDLRRHDDVHMSSSITNDGPNHDHRDLVS